MNVFHTWSKARLVVGRESLPTRGCGAVASIAVVGVAHDAGQRSRMHGYRQVAASIAAVGCVSSAGQESPMRASRRETA